jgi:hypothetical protein
MNTELIEDLLNAWMVEVSQWDDNRDKAEKGSTLESNCGIRAHEIRRCYNQLKLRLKMCKEVNESCNEDGCGECVECREESRKEEISMISPNGTAIAFTEE